MNLAKEFPCGHFRFLPTKYRKCPICNPKGRKSTARDRAAARQAQYRTAAALSREAAKRYGRGE
jgi:hypothetical protein